MEELTVTKKIISEKPAVLADNGREMRLVQIDLDVPADLIYFITKNQAGLYASFYDVVATEMGINFGTPKIHHIDDDKVRIEVACQFHNAQGLPVQDCEIVEIDVQKLYEESRLKWAPEKWTTTKEGKPFKVVDDEKLKEYQKAGYYK